MTACVLEYFVDLQNCNLCYVLFCNSAGRKFLGFLKNRYLLACISDGFHCFLRNNSIMRPLPAESMKHVSVVTQVYSFILDRTDGILREIVTARRKWQESRMVTTPRLTCRMRLPR